MIEWFSEHKVLSVLSVLFSGIGTYFVIYLFRKFNKPKESNERTIIIQNPGSESDDIVVKIPKGLDFHEIELKIKGKLTSSSP